MSSEGLNLELEDFNSLMLIGIEINLRAGKKKTLLCDCL